MCCVAFAPALARRYDHGEPPFRLSVPLCYTIPFVGIDGLHVTTWDATLYSYIRRLDLSHGEAPQPPLHTCVVLACFEVDSRKEGESYETRVKSEDFISLRVSHWYPHVGMRSRARRLWCRWALSWVGGKSAVKQDERRVKYDSACD